MNIKQILPIFLILLFSSSCANQMSPTGGPADKTPPRVIAVVPENNSTMVPLNQRVEFEFSEGIDRRSLDRAIFITPDPGERVRFKWKKRKLRLEFLDSLKTNRTHVITLGTDLKDSHGNSMQQSYTLAFSTGAEISNGKISGKVYSAKQPQGILIWAYILEGEQVPSPVQRSGDYITQTDTQGEFELTHLSEGRYRIYAVWDIDNNRYFEVGSDGLGVSSNDIELTSENLTVSDVNFKISVQDTVAPAVVSVSARDRNHLIIKFDEKILNENVDNLTNYLIQSIKSPSVDTLPVHLAYLNDRDSTEIRLITAPQIQNTEYEIKIHNLKDLSENVIDPNYNRAEFLASALPDTFKPQIISFTPADSATAVFLNTKISFYFSEAMNQQSVQSSFQLRDSSDQIVPVRFESVSPAYFNFSPGVNLNNLANYVAEVKLDSTLDLFGNPVADSLLQFTFTTLTMDTLSSISGTVVDEDSTGQGPIYLKAMLNDGKGHTYFLRLPGPGAYEFANILPGTYSIEAFRDKDENGEYGYGTDVPFLPAERFVVYPDKITVRSRWPNEGNNITFK